MSKKIVNVPDGYYMQDEDRQGWTFYENRVPLDKQLDFISRQAAIKALGERPLSWTDSDYEIAQRNQYDADLLAIETVPAADVRENVHGEWIAVDHDKWTTGTHGLICSKCGGGYHLNIEKTIDNWDYCPNCGADMRERGTDGK